MLLLSIGVVGASVFTVVILDKKDVLHVDGKFLAVVSYAGIGGFALYTLFKLASVFYL